MLSWVVFSLEQALLKIMTSINTIIKYILAAIIVGTTAGLCSATLRSTLEQANSFFHSHSWLVILLPFAGYISAWAYDKRGNAFEDATKYLFAKLSHLETPQKKISGWMLPLVYFGTTISHFFGASVGRESTMIQMTVSATEKIISKIKFFSADRSPILIASLGAGFAAAVGAPIAGFIYSVEFLKWKNLKIQHLMLSILSAAIGYSVTLIFHGHSIQNKISIENSFDIKLLLISLFLGLALGFLQYFLHKIIVNIKHMLKKIIHDKKWQAAFGGSALALYFIILQTTKFNGLGIDIIQQALNGQADIFTFVGKYFATAISLGVGFKGGEFVPSIYLGTTFAATIAIWLHLPASTLASACYVTVYSAAIRAPLACTVLTMELFGMHIGAFAFITCFASSYFSAFLEKHEHTLLRT